MEGWKDWEGKKVFIRTKNNRTYSGIVKLVELNSLPLIWIHIKDKFGDSVTFAGSEIVEIKEEKNARYS